MKPILITYHIHVVTVVLIPLSVIVKYCLYGKDRRTTKS
jgi:hypothetical protein